MPSQPKVLVVGAGPAGLVLTLALLEQGIPTRIIDKEPSHRVGAKGAGMMPRSAEVYRYLGLWPAIEKQAGRMPPMRMYAAPEGTVPLKTWHMSERMDPTPANPFMNPLMLDQSHLEAIMRERLEEHGVRVELNTELVVFEQEDSRVVAHLRKRVGDEDKEETIQISYLAGADGGRSGVRKKLGLSFLGETREETWLIYGDVEVQGLDKDHWHLWGTGFGGRGVTLRPPDGANGLTWPLICTAAGMDEKTVHAIGSDTALAEKFFYEVSGRKDIKFGKWIYLTAHRPNIRMTDTFQKGRVFIVGDAGHTHSPAGGQGLNSSIMDSFNLAWKLALVLKGASPPSLLATYNEERLPVIAEMLQRTTRLLDDTMKLEGNAKPDTSDENSGWRRGPALYQLGVNYRWSSIVVDERHSKPSTVEGAYGSVGTGSSGPLRAGDRAPDAPGLLAADAAEATRLFDLFSPARHIALVFVPSSTSANEATSPFLQALKLQPADAVRTIGVFVHGTARDATLDGADLVTVDEAGHARTAYNVAEDDGTVVVIVRPDGVVGGILTSARGVEQYFSGIF